MAVKGFEEFVVRRPPAAKPVQDTEDLAQFRVEKPYSVQSQENTRPNLASFNPPSDDPFVDAAKQTALGLASGGLGAYGNLLSLLERGVQWGASRLGVSEPTLERASQLLRNFSTSPINLPSSIMGLPTSQTIEDLAQQLGINTEPQTTAGNLARAISEGVGGAAALGVGGAGLRAVGAGSAAGQLLLEAGLPESVAKIVDIVISSNPGQLYRNFTRPITAASGLPIRSFQRRAMPTKLSAQAKQRLNQNLEDDFRNLSNRILGSSQSVQQIRTNPNYRANLDDTFARVEELAGAIDTKFTPQDIRQSLQKVIRNQPYRGYSDSEFEVTLKKERRRISQSLPKEQNISAQKGVGQFRKNNEQLSEYFEPGKSSAYNQAKKAALLEHNRAIEDTFRKKYPQSEFVRVFEKSNQDFEKLMHFEYLQEEIDKSFSGNQIDFKQMRTQLQNKPFQRALIGLLGPEMQKEYNGLIRDFSSITNPYKLIRTATKKGLDRVALEYALPFTLGPKVGASVAGIKISKTIVKELYERMLTSPSIIVEWRRGIRHFKQGNYQAAIRSFQEIEKNLNEEN